MPGKTATVMGTLGDSDEWGEDQEEQEQEEHGDLNRDEDDNDEVGD